MKILANDGISKNGQDILEAAGFEVLVIKVAQNQLENYINKNSIDVIIVRSTTEIDSEIIDNCPSLKIIARAGVGLNNIDVTHAVENGLQVINTKKASSNAVAELVFAHLFGMARFLHLSNREMPLEGDMRFQELKKAFSGGIELRGKTLGIIGLGNIGSAVAKIAIGLGMDVVVYDPQVPETVITLDFFNGQKVSFPIKSTTKEDVLKTADFITLHIPKQANYLIAKPEFEQLKTGVGIINTARGGIINEVDLVKAIEEGIVQYAALDVFETEPKPAVQLLMNPKISLSPHIGASTLEAQERIGKEIAEQIVELFAKM